MHQAKDHEEQKSLQQGSRTRFNHLAAIEAKER